MGNDHKKQAAPVKIPTAAEIKTYIMIIQTKMDLYRNKRLDSIKKKKKEAENYLRQNNLDVAKAKMDSIIRDEDMITVYDILKPLCEVLKERVTYIISSAECPPDLRAQLDSLIFASTRVEVDEFKVLRDLILRKYGQAYITKADTNADKLVNVNLEEKLKIKPASDVFVTIRLKQLCKERKIPFEFPAEVNENDFSNPAFNPFDGNNGPKNPYESFNGSGGQNYNQWNNGPSGNNYGYPQQPPNNYGNNNYGNNNYGNNNNNYGNNNYGNNNKQYNPYSSMNNNNNKNNQFNPYGSTNNNNYNNNQFNNNGQFSQPPNNNQYNNNSQFGQQQPPQNSQFNQPPQNSQFNQTSQNSQFNKPSQNSQFGPSQNNQFNQPPQNNNYNNSINNNPYNNNSQFGQQKPPQMSQFDKPPQNSQFGQTQNDNPYAPSSSINNNNNNNNSQFGQQSNNPYEPSSNENPFNQSLNNNNNNNNSMMNQPPQNSKFGQGSTINEPPKNQTSQFNNNSNINDTNKSAIENPYNNSNNNKDKYNEENPFGDSIMQGTIINQDSNNNQNQVISKAPTKEDYNIDNNNPFHANNSSDQSQFNIKPSEEIDFNKNNDSVMKENPFAENPFGGNTSNNKFNESISKNNEVNESQNFLPMEATDVKEKKQELEESNFNPFAVNNNNDNNNPFGEGFNKSLANSISNPYADNNSINVQKSNMQGSIVDDVKFKDSIPEFKNNNDDNFPK